LADEGTTPSEVRSARRLLARAQAAVSASGGPGT
jgi:hypothetical protein